MVPRPLRNNRLPLLSQLYPKVMANPFRYRCAFLCLLASLVSGLAPLSAKSPSGAQPVILTEQGTALEARYAGQLAQLVAAIKRELPTLDAESLNRLAALGDRVARATAAEAAARKGLGDISAAKGLVDHAKGKWIGGADKEIARAQTAVAKATTDTQRASAQADLAKWQANRAEGIQALAERQAAYDKVRADEPRLKAAVEAAESEIAQARSAQSAAAKSLLAQIEPLLAANRIDAQLTLAAVLADATPRRLAAYSQQGAAQAALVDRLLAEPAVLHEMLVAGGAKFGEWPRALEILEAIRKASPRASEGVTRRLALAVALEHARPIVQNNAASRVDGPAVVDPVARYQHYEKAFLAGELDPAFASLGIWELRMAVNCDAPDEILAWGREMLRIYRPDFAALPDAGWRYVMLVRTDVRYGSQNVKDDLPTLQQYQNIPLNGGVCGRRAFFGRFILRAHGIPTWGVTQPKHAALSHWTPKGWVVNLGAGFHVSWWDKDESVRGGTDFLLETQARAHGEAYLRVLRAQWISRILSETARNDRKKIAGGSWSNLAHHQTALLAATAVTLGPLGQEFAEANEPQGKAKPASAVQLSASDKAIVARGSTLVIPAAAGERVAGQVSVMPSHGGGFQVLCSAGHKATYAVEVPSAGKYTLAARVSTLQAKQRILVTTPGATAPVTVNVPHTVGLWGSTPPVEITLTAGRNIIQFEFPSDNRGVTLKELTLAR